MRILAIKKTIDELAKIRECYVAAGIFNSKSRETIRQLDNAMNYLEDIREIVAIAVSSVLISATALAVVVIMLLF